MDILGTIAGAGIVEAVAEKGTEKAAEGILSFAWNGAVQLIGKYKAAIGKSFEEYIGRASKEYDQIKTLADPYTPRSLTSPVDGIYEKINLGYQNNIIKADSATALIDICNRLIVLGDGGAGKTLMMKYLFINVARELSYVPILINLRDISDISLNSISIIGLAESILKRYDPSFNTDEFKNSLGSIKYLFLLDGFDEVRQSHKGAAIKAIKSFGSSYPNIAIFITTRPDNWFTGVMNNYQVLTTIPLNKKQACNLAGKLWPQSDKISAFCKLIEEKLYDDEKYHSFAENPLLLTIMGLVFIKNNTIPDRIVDFYDSAYYVIFRQHDSYKEGVFERDLKCDQLQEYRFKGLFAAFCYRTYVNSIFTFSRTSIIEFILRSMKKLEINDVPPENYLEDIITLCLMTEAGQYESGKYGELFFTHRSFQAYFAALYVKEMEDCNQEKALKHLLSNDLFESRLDFYEFLNQLQEKRFRTVIRNGVEEIVNIIKDSPKHDWELLKLYIDGIHFETSRRGYNCHLSSNIPSNQYYHNILILFRMLVSYSWIRQENNDHDNNPTIQEVKRRILNHNLAEYATNSALDTLDDDQVVGVDIDLRELESEWEDLEEIYGIDSCNEFIRLLIAYTDNETTYEDMCKWLEDKDEPDDSIDDL